MKKFFLVVAVVLVAAVGANAQIKFGPKVGLNVSTLSAKAEGVNLETKGLVGYHIGLILQKDLKNNLFLEPGILFSSKGSKYDINNDIKIVANYIEVPVNLGYNIPFDKYSVQIKVGPYFAYGVGGTYQLVKGVSQDIKWGSGDDDMLKPFDMGINLGGGVQVNNFQVSVQYGIGLLNVDNGSEGSSKNGVFGFSVAYLF